MSDVAAAAAALGLPEPLVERSAAARAAETGQSVDEILAAWAGGEAPAAPAPDSTPPAASEEQAEPEAAPTEPEPVSTPEIVIDTPQQEAPAASAPSGPYRAPVLVGAKDNPMVVLAGVIGVFIIVVMVGLIGPSVPTEEPGARTSEIAYTELAAEGQHIYETTGCAACHTQMVRPVVADVGLGPVTLSDTNQVLGTTRFGPDLSDVGSRLTGSQIEAVIQGLGDHPAHSLGGDDLAALVAYLTESVTSVEEVES